MKATVTLDATIGEFCEPAIAWLALRGYPEPKELPEGFAEWFEGSQAIEPTTGKPRIFYHGSNTPFTRFAPTEHAHSGWYKWRRTAKGRTDRCHFLTGDPSLAMCYGEWIMLAYLRIRNPVRVPTRDAFTDAVCDSDKLHEQGFDAIVFGDRYQSEYAIFDPGQAWIVASYPSYVPAGHGAVERLLAAL